MAAGYTYTLSLLDKMSGPLKTVSATSMHVMEKLSQLKGTQEKLKAVNTDLGGSITSLRTKLELLKQEREIISPADIKAVRKYNIEIAGLEKQLSKLDNLGQKSNGLERLNLTAGIQQAQATSEALSNLSQTGIGFEQGVADLSAITGIAGADLEYLSDVARKTGKDSGMGAAQGVEAFKLLASQIDVSKIGIEGLTELQKRTITLAQASGMTMADSANALAGTINQFGLQANEANRIINVLAAGSKYGAAEIPELAQSFKVVGAAANAAGLSVESTAGAIEVLSKNNLKGAEAGTALRNIVLKMQTALGYDFRKTSLTQALDDLKPKLTDATYLSKIFGMENISAAQFLISNSAAVTEMTARVTDSNVAQEQASIRTETTQVMMARCKAAIDDLKIGFFEATGSFGGYATIIAEQAVTVSQLIPLLSFLGSGIMWLTKIENLKAIATVASAVATKVAAGAQWLLNAALTANPVGLVVVGIIAMIAVIIFLCTKIQGWGSLWEGVVGFMKYSFEAFTGAIVLYFSTAINGIMMGLDLIKLGWYEFKEACGIGDSSENQSAIAKINESVEARQNAIIDGAKKVAESANKAQDSLAGIDMSWNSDKSFSDVTGELQAKAGIDVESKVPEIPAGGTVDSAIDGAGGGASGGGGLGGGLGNLGGGGAAQGNSALGLNKVATSIKGSTAYAAIASKLSRVVVPTMAAASVATMSLPPASEASLPPTRETMTEHYQENNNYTKETGVKSIVIENITINIANASPSETAKLPEMIRMELSKLFS